MDGGEQWRKIVGQYIDEIGSGEIPTVGDRLGCRFRAQEFPAVSSTAREANPDLREGRIYGPKREET